MNLQHRHLFILIVLILIASFCQLADAAPRKVLVEGFTQWNCGPCASWNPQELTIMQAMGEDTVIGIKYHGWWPGSNDDPFFNWNVSENTARINFYGVTWEPWVMCDGLIDIRNVSAATLRSSIRSRKAINAPCSIEATATQVGQTSVAFSATIAVETTVSGSSIKAFAALVSDSTNYATSHGTNGETIFRDAFRDMAPNTTGLAITLIQEDTITFTGTLNKDAAWDPDHLSVIVFVQRTDGNKEIYQAAKTNVTRPWGMTVLGDGPRQLIVEPNAGETLYTVELTNIGQNTETYHVVLSGLLPAGWIRTIEGPGIPANADSILVTLANGESSTLIARMNPNGHAGGAVLNITVNSPSSSFPITSTETFRLMSGLDILLVDDDEGQAFDSYYESALASVAGNMMWGRWDVSQDSLRDSYFDNLDAIVWFTGNSFQDGYTLSAADQEKLSVFLDRGGKLFLSGQGIGFDIRTDQFFINYLHARYERNYPTGVSVSGVTGDPISDGMSFAITGGDGAGNQSRQTAISARDDLATVIFDYTSSAFHAGLKATNGTYKVVYLGFGLEAISSAANRIAVLQRSFDWLFGNTSISDDNHNSLLPAKFELQQNYPNPFNPETVIRYSLPSRAEVSLRIFDLLGREVTVLASGTKDAGNHSATWNAADFSSGVFFCQLEAIANGQTYRSTNKMVLLK